MTVLTGRTPSQYLRFIIGDTSNVLREVPVRSVGPLGLSFPEVDLSALQDALDGFAAGRPGFEMEFGGPYDTSAAVSVAASGNAPALSGSATVLEPLNGLMTPRSWAVYIGMDAYWETGAPVFGVSRTSTSGVWVSKFQVVPGEFEMLYSARIRMIPGSAKPAWGTSAIT